MGHVPCLQLLPVDRRNDFGKKMLKVLIGADFPPNRIIATPLTSIFDAIAEGLPVNGGGWWKNASSKETTIVKVPQGSPSLDLLCSLLPNSEYVHVGYAGLTKRGQLKYGLGQLLSIQSAVVYPGIDKAHEASLTYDGLPAVSCLSVPNFACSFSIQDSDIPYDCIDMEVGLAYCAASLYGIRASCIQIVSDSARFDVTSEESRSALRTMFRESMERVRQLCL